MAESTSRVLRALVLPIYLPTVLNAVGVSAITPVIPLFALRLGFSETGAAALTIVTGVLGVLGPIPVGAWMQRVGERFAMIVTGLALVAVNVGGWWLLEHATARPTSRDRLAFVAVLAAMGVTMQVWQLGRQSYLGRELPPELRATGMSTFGGMMRIGAIIGPALGAAVLSWGHPSWVYLTQIVMLCAATALVTFCMVPHERHGTGRKGDRRPTERVNPTDPAPYAPGRPALTTMFLGALGAIPLTIGRMARPTILPLAGAAWGLDEAAVSLVFAIAAAAEIALFAPAGMIMDRFGRAAVAVPCLVIMGVGYVGLGAATPWLSDTSPRIAGIGLGVIGVLLALGNGLGSGILMTLGVDFSPDQAQTKQLARWRTILGAGQLAAPAMVTAVTVIAPIATAGWAVGALCIAGGAWFARFLPRNTPLPRGVRAGRPDPSTAGN